VVGVEKGLLSFSAVEGERVLAMWGLCTVNLLGDTGIVWLLTAEHNKNKHLVRESRRFVDYALTIYPVLMGYVAADYPGAIKLLLHLGFSIESPEKLSVTGKLFCRFVKRR